MIAVWVTVRVKPELRDEFLRAIEADAVGSERDEPGCIRFNVLRNVDDENVYHFYEVYASEEARLEHRAAPHYAVWKAAAHTLDGSPTRDECRPVFPAAPSYWTKQA
jgi:(4S)-4-hydroxy-5-phosphonooxypentane-2,3-dione isomerase